MTTYGIDLGAGLPSGIIIIWSGGIDDIPRGWKLCDGTNGTPDLRDRFVKSVPNSSTNPGAVGGEAEHTLLLSEIPSHSHVIHDAGHQHQSNLHGSNFGAFIQPRRIFGQRLKTLKTTSETPSISISTTGNDEPHENKPAFFEVLYIQKS